MGLAPASMAELPIPKAALVSMGRADLAVNGNNMTINQRSDRAILNWEKFNIGKDNSVVFKQPGSSSIALNRIYDSDPSQIFGRLSANGQVYLLNPNGFLFGKDSLVNVNTLVASSLDITDETFERGVTKVFNQDGRAALVGTGQVYRRDADGNYVLDANGNRVKIAVQFDEGAKVITDKAGRIIAAAPSVINKGELSAPDGQILMVAATDKVYLQETSGDPSLRGLVVEVGTGGDVTNVGKMLSARGNVTLMGFAVNQRGLVSATTSVQANGSVRLLAREGATARREGDKWLLQPGSTRRNASQDDGLGVKSRVTLAKGSVTEATPNLKDKATAVDGQTQEASRIEVMGKEVRIEEQATLRSHSGLVTLTATENPANPGLPNVKNDSKVTIANGAKIDVSGVKNVKLAMERNVVEVELRSNELRDSPLQKDGVLYGKTVKVDIRKGTPIADITGALDRIARTVAERSTAGGSLNINSEGDAILARGSLIDISGGSLKYRPGYVNTTRLIGPNGFQVDIGSADPNMRYEGIVKPITARSSSWNYAITNSRIGPPNGRYESGYVEGKSAGALNIQAAAAALEGEMQAAAVNGSRQRTPELQAMGGILAIDLARTQTNNQSVEFGKKTRPGDISPDEGIPVSPDHPGQPLALTIDGDKLRGAGLQRVAVNTHSGITIQKGERIDMIDGGELSLAGGQIDVSGSIVAKSGKVDLKTHIVGGNTDITGAINLSENSLIDTSGGWNNDRPAVASNVNKFNGAPLHIEGGSVTVKAEGDVNVGAGSTIDVSGGAHRQLNLKLVAGDAGRIALEAAGIDGSDLSVQGQLLGHAVVGGKGGSLSLISDQVVLGGQIPSGQTGDVKPLLLDGAFFSKGGFASYTVGSNKSGVTVAPGATIKVAVESRVLMPEFVGKATGSDLKAFSYTGFVPEVSRPAGDLSLVLSQTVGFGGRDAAIRIGNGANISTETGGGIHLQSDGSILVNGGLTARAGEISMDILPPSVTDAGFLPNQGIWLGNGANLDVSGASRIYTDGLGRLSGEVLDGGTINLQADRGFIVADAGSRMNVSGAADLLDIPTPGANQGYTTQRRLIASSGGTLALQAAEGMQLFGSMRADRGGEGAAGGELRLELNPLTRNEPDQVGTGQLPFPKVPSVISLKDSLAAGDKAPTQGSNILQKDYGKAYLTAGQIRSGGFSTVSLRSPDQIEFNGGVTLNAEHSINLDAPVLAFKPGSTGTASTVAINAAQVSLGSTQTRPGKSTPTSGSGRLQVQAGLVDLTGATALQGFGTANLDSQGDMRLIGVRTTQQQRDFLGEFLTAGDLRLRASQIYPTTLTDFRVAVQGKPDGVLTIARGSNAAGPVLSAAGKLTLEAPNIVQGGTLKAPMGQINLKATDKLELVAGSLTSNSADGSIIPFGRGQGGLDWIYPLGQQNLVFDAPPEKKLSLEGASVNIATGANIDTRGGGDLFSYEFVPGPGGSYDILDPASAGYQGSYAVIPGFGSSAAPVDPLELPGSGLKVGDSVYLAGGGGLAAGHYVLLPARYALLPGAFLVTPRSGLSDLAPGRQQRAGNGAMVMAGYRTVAGTSIHDARWSGFAVETGQQLRQRAEYTTYRANKFYAQKAADQDKPVPFLPQDAGSLVISAKTALNLDGQINAAAGTDGRGGRLDISADNISVVARNQVAQAVNGSVQLVAEKLNALAVSSIALGGVRTTDDDGVNVKVNAANVTLGQDAQLRGKEFILTAKQNINLSNGSSLTAIGGKQDASGKNPVYRINGDAALLRVSAGPQADLQRTNVQGRSGSITVASGATVTAPGSMMLDATANNNLSGTLNGAGGSVALGAQRISLGNVDYSASGLVLTQAQLDALKSDELILNSGSDISLYGAAKLDAGQLVLRSGGLLGYANAGQTATITADDIRIDNPFGMITTRTSGTRGNLLLSAKTMTLGEGAYEINGFGNVGLTATQSITGDQAGQLTAQTNLNFSAPVLTGSRGADTRIDATGYAVSIENPGNTQAADNGALGARLAITADSIRQGGAIDLRSGDLKLEALKGDVTLANGSRVNVSGRTVNLGKSAVATSGGSIELSSQNGNIAMNPGASLLLGGYQGGTLTVEVPQGAFNLVGNIDAQGQQAGGRFILDVGSSAVVGALGSLGENLADFGFTDQISLRARTGDWALNQSDSLAARLVALAADQGGLRVDGAITARGADAEISLSAADRLQLGATARLQAQGTADQRGRVSLDAVDGNGNGNSGINLAAGARIDVADNKGVANGEVRLRADRSGQDVAVEGNLGDTIAGSKDTTVEAVQIHERTGTMTAADIEAWKAETDSYMANAGTIENRLGLPGGLLAGLEVKSSGDLTLDATGWDLVDWRYGGRAGVLTLNAGKNLNIRGKLTDGFRDDPQGIDLTGTLGPGNYVAVQDLLQPGNSWSYQLKAGQDVTLGANSMVRTGTGDIGIQAGRDMVLTNSTASIYTAGRPTETGRYGSLQDSYVAYNFFGEYPVDGGDIRIAAGRDVSGAQTGQFFDGWFARMGNWSNNADHTGETPTAWSVAIGGPVGTGRPVSTFNQNIGALGGGGVSVDAGRDVSNLSVVIPTTGKQVGTRKNPGDPKDTNFLTNVVDIQGGGNLSVRAGGDVLGGTYYTGRGNAEISAAGSIKGSEASEGLGPVIALGDSRFTLKAGDSIELGAALNPTVVSDSRSKNYFFTYTANSGLNLQALAGDVTLQNNIGSLVDQLNARRPGNNQIRFPGVAQDALSVYPAGLNVAALQGDIVFGRTFVTYPSATADFNLLAGGNITTGASGNNVNITQSDADALLLPSVANPATSWEDASQRLQPFGSANLIHAQTPVHRGDPNPATIYTAGSILSRDPLLFSLPKAVEVQAGQDLLDVSFQVQQPDYALSTINAGRDIRFTSPRNAQGNLVNLTREIRVAGPGQVWVTAGRTIDLGASEGIYTIGNTNNSALAEEGASISVLAGIAKAPRYDAFAKEYDPLNPKYANELTNYMRARLGDPELDHEGAVDGYAALPQGQRQEFLLAVLFREIRDAAAAAAKSGKLSDYDSGYAAIDTLFPGAGSKDSPYHGDLKLFFSKIHTVAGGDINLLVPGGMVNAGLAVAFSGAKPASELGIVAQRDGAINGMVNGDFQVNQSRVFAMNGGDITLWSSNGNIDAGRGAKAAIAAPPPIVTFDAQGNLKVEFPPVVSGSGIRTAASTAPRPGDVFLAAPKGVVDAGEAGIGGTNVTIAATAVIGASNISVSGTSTGVPSTNVAVPVAPAGAAAAATAATNTAAKTAEDAVVNDTNQANEKNELPQRLAEDTNRLNPLQVDILGYGECGVVDVKDGKPGCV